MLVEANFPANQTGSRALQQHLFSLLQSCNTLKKLTQIHTQIIIHNFTQKNFILVKLLSFYINSKNLLHGRRLFESIENPSTNVWNQIIRGYSKTELGNKSVEFYKKMVRNEAEPDGFTYSYVINGCAQSRLLKEGEQIHGKVLVNGYCSNVFVLTNLIYLYSLADVNGDMKRAHKLFDEMTVKNMVSFHSLLAGYIKCGNVDTAGKLFDEMPEKNIVSWTTMIAGSAQNGKCKHALNLFREMRKTGVDLDQVVCVTVLSACAELGDLKMGRWIHLYVEETSRVKNQPLLVSLQNALIHMYASCGMIEEAYEVFKGMKQRSLVSWTSMITGFAKQGFAKEALKIFQWMQSSIGDNVKPDGITFIGILSACSHAGFVDEGRHFFKSMSQKWGIQPKIEHYGCMVDLLSRAGFLNEAHALIQTMPMKPNHAIWGALLGGCMVHRNPNLGAKVAHNLEIGLDPDRDAGYLVLLANVYAMGKMWREVLDVRRKMIELDVKKPSGRSWIHVNGNLHEFVVNDLNHEFVSLIYEVLSELTIEAKREGYNKPDLSEGFFDVE